MPAEQLEFGPNATAFDGWFGGTRVIFGSQSFDALGSVLDEAVLPAPIAVVASRSQARLGRIDALVRNVDASGVFTDARDHTSAELIADAIESIGGCNSILALGGGAAIGLAKALAVEEGLPFAAIPTTYSGSEMTELYGLSSHGVKTVRRSDRARARAVLYDPELFESLPPQIAKSSLFNCIAHCIEAAWIAGAPPLGLMTALESCRLIGGSSRLDDLVTAGWFGGVTLATVGVGVHHTICHVLGAATGVPHSLIHALVLPESMWLNRDVARSRQHQLARALCGSTQEVPQDAVRRLRREWSLPGCLREVWSGELDVDDVVDKTLASAATVRNARPITRAALRECIGRVIDGV